MSLGRFTALRQRGDTIVEVMIVLAVLGLAISISYATANRSLLNARQAQENSEATEFVQAQVEALAVLAPNASTDPNYIFQPTLVGRLFCINDGVIVTSGFTTSNPFDIGGIADNTYPAGCRRGTDSRYHLSISYGGVASNDTFTVMAVWDDVRGDTTQDSVTLVYRTHQQ